MSSPTYLLSVDIGTEGCKAIIFNEKGESLARSYHEHPMIVPEPSWAEQDPNLWWYNVKKAISDILKTVEINVGQIACITLTGQSPVLVPVDKFGRPLMNAIIWMDRRAVKQSEILAQITGITEDPSMILPKIMWVKEQRPKTYRKTHKFLQATDFIQYKLVGRFVTDWLNAFTAHFNSETHQWPEETLEQLDIPPDKLPDVARPGDIVGTVTEEASHEIGLEKGIPVIVGGIDAYLAVIGVNALREGAICEITGSSTCLMAPSNREVKDPKGRMSCQIFPLLPNFWITWAVMSSTGASLRWFRDRFGNPGESYEELDKAAEKVSAGSDGLIFLPYMMGERSPIWSPAARGVFIGLSLHHSRNHVIRAILEGCAFGIHHNLEIMEGLGCKVNEIWSCGGAARSGVLSQIKSDVTGKPIIIPREIEAPALGAAILGAVGVGIYDNINEAAENMVQIMCRFNPRIAVHNKYGLFFQMYKDAYLHLKDYFEHYYSPKDVSRVRQGS